MTVELNRNYGVRPVRLVRTCQPGDIRDGSVLPTKYIKTFRVISDAFWDGKRLVRLVTSTASESPSGEKGGRTDDWLIEQSYFGEGAGQFAMQIRIPNRTNVFLTQSPQLKAEWRDGEIVKVYASGDIESLKKISFANKPFNVTFWLTIAVVAVLGGACWLGMRKTNK